MGTTQLNVRVPVELAERLRNAARERHSTPGALVAQALEQFLTAPLAIDSRPLAIDRSGLAEVLKRLESLEQKTAKQSQQAHHLPHGPAALAASAPPPKQMNQLEALPDRRLTPQEAEGLLTGPQLCAALGLASESSFTNWIRRLGPVEAVGQVFHGHRLLGKGLLPGSAKPIWLWRKV